MQCGILLESLLDIIGGIRMRHVMALAALAASCGVGMPSTAYAQAAVAAVNFLMPGESESKFRSLCSLDGTTYLGQNACTCWVPYQGICRVNGTNYNITIYGFGFTKKLLFCNVC